MSANRNRRSGLCVVFCVGLVLMQSVAVAQNSGTMSLGGPRTIYHEVLTDPKILTLEVTEMLATTAKVQVRFIQETECKILTGMVGKLQNVADQLSIAEVLSADLISNRLEEMFKADIDAASKSTDYEGGVTLENCNPQAAADEGYAAIKAEAIEKLISGGFEEQEPVFRTVGNVTVTWTPWMRKVGTSGTGLGEVKGTVKLRLDADLDKENFIFLGGFTEVATPDFQIRNQPRSGPEREQARAQYKAFQVRFNTAYLALLQRLNKPSKLFKTKEESAAFRNGPVGDTASKIGYRNIPFMGKRYRWRIGIIFTAGDWKDDSTEPQPPALEDGD